MNNLYGPKFIEKQRSSGYKSTVYAMAEIIDNAIDAGAKNIEIIFVEKETTNAGRTNSNIHEIIFYDDGKGMTKERINTCLTFSEGEGKSQSRIGAFGVGLPNSSISVGRKVEVYSKDSNSNWNYVYLDLDDQVNRPEAGYDEAINLKPDFNSVLEADADVKTIVKWSKLDMIDASKASTIITRASKLFGRLYRYEIQNGLSIRCSSYISGNAKLTIEPITIIPYDPLFVTTNKNYITDHVWKWANEEDPKGIHPVLGENHSEFRSSYHYKKFIKDCIPFETTLPLFQRFEDYWDVEYQFKVGDIAYNWKIKASFAGANLTNPGIRSGGATSLGREFGVKMSGNKDFKSANIFFIRANREIDFGSFGLYTVTDEKNRFWTIEIHFDSELDHLMGVSNNKQSVDFNAVQNSEIEELDITEDTPIGIQKEKLWAQMTEAVSRCIRKMKDYHRRYASAFKELEKSKLAEEDEDSTTIPQLEGLVIRHLPRGSEEWTDEQKREIANFLKERFMHIPKSSIDQQVEIYAQGLTKTLVLYSPNETNNLFELIEKRSIHITLINTNHVFYQNIIEPLKNNKSLKIFAISIEMLISSNAIEMDRLITDNEQKYKHPLETYLLQLSSRLNEFINDSKIQIVPEDFEKMIIEELDEEV